MSDTKSTEDWVSSRAGEPVLDIDQIQGNTIPGFNKDFQVLLFLKIVEGQESNFKRWLQAFAPRITTMKEVLDFRRLLKKEERRREPPKVKATWVNIAFSHTALWRLGVLKEGDLFKDRAFREGLWRRSESLGDPKDRGEGDPRTWVVGGPDNEADVLLIIASDDRLDLYDEVARIENSIYAPGPYDGKPDRSGAKIIFKQHGANLPGSLAGHEHFGFRDGISQPGVRGRISNKTTPDKDDYLTPCENNGEENQGKPGQDLLWPGEFVFGAQYSKQDPTDDKKARKNSLGEAERKNTSDETELATPKWAQNGSFLVFRRLRQDVGAFHTFLRDQAKQYKVTPDHFGAMCVGRWASGAPLLRAQAADDKELAADDRANNYFKFQKKSPPSLPSDQRGKPDYSDIPDDPPENICPFAAHIRRTNIRDDMNKNEAQTPRLLRRGIPYGEPSQSSPAAPFRDSVDRGLLFLAYQISIENQFEFIQKRANNPWFKEGEPGYDPIIGQNNRGNPRTFRITLKDGQAEPPDVNLPEIGWVIPTGGGYFFVPSIKVVKDMSAHTR